MSELKKITLDCNVEQKSFIKEDGSAIDYLDLRLIVGENSVKVYVDSKDKSLFKYLIKDYLD